MLNIKGVWTAFLGVNVNGNVLFQIYLFFLVPKNSLYIDGSICC